MKRFIANEELQAFWEFCVSTRLEFKCRACLGQFSPTTFNEFECTKVLYTKLVRMVRLCWEGKNAYQIHILAEVNYCCGRLAWGCEVEGIVSSRRATILMFSGKSLSHTGGPRPIGTRGKSVAGDFLKVAIATVTLR